MLGRLYGSTSVGIFSFISLKAKLVKKFKNFLARRIPERLRSRGTDTCDRPAHVAVSVGER
jgi:hypothetical protein